MSALLANPVASPTLRVVPAMPAADGGPSTVREKRIKNTIRCQHELVAGSPCGVPLAYVTASRDYIASKYADPPIYRLIAGVPHLLVTCPHCGTVRTVRLH